MSDSKNNRASDPADRVDSKRRLNIVLPDASWSRLERIKDYIEADTYTEVVKDAFRLFEYVIMLEKNNSKLMVKNAEGDVSTLELFKINAG
jgi:hypothetical protein